MPIYHFEVTDQFPPMITEGVELETLAMARSHALQFAGQVLGDQPPQFWEADDWVLTVSDTEHRALFIVTVATSGQRCVTPLAADSGDLV